MQYVYGYLYSRKLQGYKMKTLNLMFIISTLLLIVCLLSGDKDLSILSAMGMIWSGVIILMLKETNGEG